MRPDLAAIEALDAVVRHGGVAQAAARLHKVQSAVSYQLAKLERQLGLRLLDRSAYRTRLTPAGEAVLAEGRRLLVQAEHVASVARQFTAGWEPRLTVIVDGMLPLRPTLEALKTLANERVPTRIQVKVEFLGGVQFRFDQNGADLMVVKDYQPAPQLHAEALADIECVLCASREHVLARMSRVTLLQLLEYVELSVQDSSGQGDDRHMFGGERVFFLSDFGAKKQALMMGLGFGWMPRYLVERELRAATLREVRYVGGSRYRFTPMLVHRLDRPRGPTGMRLAALLGAQSTAAKPSRHGTRGKVVRSAGR